VKSVDASRIIVVGGHTRNIGKTALVVDILRAFPQMNWTAVKITQYGHGVCSINGEDCGCAPTDHAFSVSEEDDRSGKSDTSRFLVAGAARALWVRTKQGQLATALPALREALAGAGNVIIESNTLLGFIKPRLYLAVLDPRLADFKPSAQRSLDLADAYVLRSPQAQQWLGVSESLLSAKPRIVQPLGEPLPHALVDLLRSNLAL